MKRMLAVFLILGLLLPACNVRNALPNVAENTNNSAAQAPQAGSANEQTVSEAEDEGDATQAAGESTPAPTEEPYLSALATYEMIGTVQANILSVESWLAQGISDHQRQAMVGPVVALSMAPLAEIFAANEPEPALALQWDTAEDIHTRFYPQVTAWVNDEIDDRAFGDALVALKVESNEMISQADQIANRDFEIDTEAYLPDYAPAMGIVFELSDMQTSAQAQPGTQENLPAPSENANLLVKEVTPYIYAFAGSELFSVIGLVENTGATPLVRVEVTLRFYNAAGEYLGTTWGSTMGILAEPGKTYPFTASTVTDGEEIVIREQWASYDVTAYARPLSRELDDYYHEFDLALVSVSQNNSGTYTIEGSLTNLGAEAVDAEALLISAAAFDAEGKLVGVGKSNKPPGGMLGPGGGLTFEVLLRAVSGEPVRYQFYAEVVRGN